MWHRHNGRQGDGRQPPATFTRHTVTINRVLENGPFSTLRGLERYKSERIAQGETGLHQDIGILRDYCRTVADVLSSAINQAIDKNHTIVPWEAYAHLLAMPWASVDEFLENLHRHETRRQKEMLDDQDQDASVRLFMQPLPEEMPEAQDLFDSPGAHPPQHILPPPAKTPAAKTEDAIKPPALVPAKKKKASAKKTTRRSKPKAKKEEKEEIKSDTDDPVIKPEAAGFHFAIKGEHKAETSWNALQKKESRRAGYMMHYYRAILGNLRLILDFPLQESIRSIFVAQARSPTGELRTNIEIDQLLPKIWQLVLVRLTWDLVLDFFPLHDILT